MNKVLIVIMFILLGTSLIVVSNMNKGVENSFTIEYQNNKNLLFPDLEGRQEISVGLYRLYNANGITLDYQIYSGKYLMNGTATNNGIIDLMSLQPYNNLEYTSTIYIIDGSYVGSLWFKISQGRDNVSYMQNQLYNYDGLDKKSITATLPNYIKPMILYNTDYTYYNLQFKIQLEKGDISTSYVVPKLIPVYKDNLTQQEKNDIGLGAFGGISKIIKTINDIIKPVGDFINGLLSLF